MTAEVEEVPLLLLPCGVCGRTFRPEALAKHSAVCERSLVKKRKQFDSAKQRKQGTELADFAPLPSVKAKKPPSPKKPHSRWKEKHEALVKTIRDENCGKPADHQQCEYCARFFGPKAFDRHVAWCKDQHAKIQIHSEDVSKAKCRLEARTKYRAPSFRSQRSLTKEKYSPHRGGEGKHYLPPSPPPRTKPSSVDHRGDSNNNHSKGDGSVGGGNRQSSRTKLSRQGSVRATTTRRKEDTSPISFRTNTNRAWSMSSLASDSKSVASSHSLASAQSVGSNQSAISNHSSASNHSVMSEPDPRYNKPTIIKSSLGKSNSLNRRWSPSGGVFTTEDTGHSETSADALSKFCHECGGRYPVPGAKFCCICGVRRLAI